MIIAFRFVLQRQQRGKLTAVFVQSVLIFSFHLQENIKPEIRYPPMRDALNATGVPIFFSMCEWGVDNPYEWAPTVGNSWRSTGDISDNWKRSVVSTKKNKFPAENTHADDTVFTGLEKSA